MGAARWAPRRRWLPPVWLAVAIACLAAAPGAGAKIRRTPTLVPSNVVVDGPTPNIVGLEGMSIARDGDGGLVYTETVGGVPHVFVSRLTDGFFHGPVQVDAGLANPSTQPVIAAGPGGLLIVAFINDGTLYVASTASTQSPIGAPTSLVGGAVNPALSVSTYGKAYLAFTSTQGSTSAVRAAFYDGGQWSLEPTALNDEPDESAGTGTGRPSVVACGDGVGIVAWGEAGHVFTRRVSGTVPSVVDEQADPSSQDGGTEISSGDPEISSGGDSSYASVAFQEEFQVGAGEQSRVLMNHLHGSQYDGVLRADGLAMGGPEGALDPQTAVTEFGAGWVTSQRDQSNELFAAQLGQNEGGQAVQRIDSSSNLAAADAVPATAGTISTLIAWQQTPGVSGPAEIRVRYAPDGSDLGPEQVVSEPALGPVDADLGLAAGGDLAGDAAIAWVQGDDADRRIVTAQLFQTPGPFVPGQSLTYATSAEPLLSWSPSSELWGPPRYTVELDGAPITQTYSITTRTPSPIANGPHTWEVTATNQGGLATAARAATVFVDTVAPRATVRVTGARRVGARLEIRLTDSDPGGRRASGIDGPAQLRWGDGTRGSLGRSAAHTYRRAGTYTVTVIVTDRAGNRTVVKRRIRIAAKPRPGRATTKRHRPARGGRSRR
ncbi:MAG: PKD domain-containing protein [Solirubrobacterales bacterium]|nr:PKD domain-containing protein [Solirubrobacterales bacterium]